MSSEFVAAPGIRVVRVLARDPHLERLLVQVDDDGPAPAEVIRAIDAVGVRRVGRLIAALDRLDTVGLGSMSDVLSDAHAPAVLVAHRRGTPLSELLLARGRWQAGEAVSLLTPVVEVVAGMHDAGVAHGTLGAARILVTDEGAEVLGLDGAELFAPGAPEVVRESVDAVARDRQALRELAVDVLERIDGSRANAAEHLLSRVRSAPVARVTPELIEGLAQLAAAIPVRLDVAPEVDAPVSERVVERRVPEHSAAPRGALARLFAELGGAAAYTAFLDVLARVRALADRAPVSRRRLVIGGGAAVATAGMLLAIIPPADRGPSAAADLSSAPPSVSTPPTASGETDVDADPADAVATLLARRDACFRELSVLCLEGVDQAGSAALDDDRRALLSMRDGGAGDPASVEVVRVRVVERLGDSALVELGPETAPASLLLMRSEAGWRIRDWVAGG